MKTYQWQQLGSVLLILCVGCGSIEGNGEAVSEEREIGSFGALTQRSSVPIRVFVDDDVAGSVNVTCDSNLLEYLIFDVDGDHLVLRHPEGVSIRPKAPCYVDVVMPRIGGVLNSGSGAVTVSSEKALSSLETIETSGSGDVDVTSLCTATRMELSSSGSGSADVKEFQGHLLEVISQGSGGVRVRGGSSRDVFVTSRGSANVDVSEVVATTARVASYGSGRVSVRSTGRMDVVLAGSGDVVVFGQPTMAERSVSGSGSIVRR